MGRCDLYVNEWLRCKLIPVVLKEQLVRFNHITYKTMTISSDPMAPMLNDSLTSCDVVVPYGHMLCSHNVSLLYCAQ